MPKERKKGKGTKEKRKERDEGNQSVRLTWMKM